MKAFTDIEQSKTLAKILPIESADMYYWCGDRISIGGYKAMDKDLDIPAWSLSALLQIIPKDIEGLNRLRIDIDNVDFSIWYDDLKGYGVNDKLPDITLKEPVDACVKMIVKLKEKGLI